MRMPVKAGRLVAAAMLLAVVSATVSATPTVPATERGRLILLGTKGGPSVRDMNQVHEVMYLPALEPLTLRSPNAKTLMKHLLSSHTTTEDVGRIAAAAGVKNVVLTHFVPGADPAMRDEHWLEGVRMHYGGNVVLGRDRLEIPLD